MQIGPGHARTGFLSSAATFTTATYEDLVRAAAGDLAEFGEWRRSPAADAARKRLGHHLREAARWSERRGLHEAERVLRSRDPLLDACSRMFLSARLGPLLWGYLALQESARNADGDAAEARLIRCFVLHIGRNGLGGIRLMRRSGDGSSRVLFHLRLEPFTDLRRAYLRHLQVRRAKRQLGARDKAAIGFHMARARASLALLRGTLWACSRLLAKRGRAARMNDLKARYGVDVAGVLGAVVSLCFTTQHASVPPCGIDAERLATEVIPYLERRVLALWRVLPDSSLRDHGLAKLGKMALGALLARARGYDSSSADVTAYACDSLRMAYYWGTTYPLIDDILDAPGTPSTTREILCQTVDAIFAAGPGPVSLPDAMPDAVQELASCLSAFFALIPADRFEGAKAVLRFLFEAHRQDVSLPLSTASAEAHLPPLLPTALLKGALVRIATAVTCGAPPDPERLRTLFTTGLLNQMTDDLWDAGKDTSEDRLTPTTAYIAGIMEEDPVALYFDLTAHLVADRDEFLTRAAAFRVAETARQATEGPAVGGRLTQAVQRLLLSYLSEEEAAQLLAGAPHVDPDAIVFGLEAGFRPSLARFLGPRPRECLA